ncbi:MAG: hypothetical protein AAF797_10925 [Planctomycetota bacterium]
MVNDGMEEAKGLGGGTGGVVWPMWAKLGLAALVLGGWGLLGRALGKAGSLYSDDIAILTNILELGMWDYAGPLWRDQIAPWGFMVAVRGCSAWLGNSEWSFRLVPFGAAVLSLPVFAWLVMRLCVPWAGLVVMFGFVASGEWLLQATRVKPYTLDVLFALLVLAVAVRVVDRRCGWGWGVLLGLVGGVGSWFSVSLPVVVAAGGMVLVGVRFWQGGWKGRGDWGPVVLAGVLSAGLAGVHLVGVLLPQRAASGTAEYMASFWARGFLPLPIVEPGQFVLRVMLFVEDATRLALPGLVLGLALLGCWAWVRVVGRKDEAVGGWGWRGVLVVSPVLLAGLLAMAELYPMQGRLALYLGPSVFLALGVGLEWLRGVVGGWGGAVLAGVASALVLSLPVGNRGGVVIEDDVVPVLEAVHDRLESGQRVYLHYPAAGTYLFYVKHLQPDLAFEADCLIIGSFGRRDWLRYDDDVREVAAEPGAAWMVLTASGGNAGLDEAVYLGMLMDRNGTRLDRIDGRDAYAVLWRPGVEEVVDGE